VLALIEAENALPPLMVVEALASGPHTTLDVCQEYLERQFASDFAVIHEDRKESEKCDNDVQLRSFDCSYRKDTEAAQKEMDAQLKQSRRCERIFFCAFCQTSTSCCVVSILSVRLAT
jgi:hypothetical protein